MEARLWRNAAATCSRNICFVYNALANGPASAFIIAVETCRNHLVSLCVDATAGFGFYGIAPLGGFDGPFVALLPAAIYSPRSDNFYHRARGKIHLRRRHWAAYFCSLPDRRSRAADFAQPRTRARRDVHGGQLRRRKRFDCGCAGHPDGSTGGHARLGQTTMVAALSGQTSAPVQSTRPRQEQCRAPLRSRRQAVFAVSRFRQTI